MNSVEEAKKVGFDQRVIIKGKPAPKGKVFFLHCDGCNDLIVDVDDYICDKTHESITGKRIVECKLNGDYNGPL
jgi:hypothetical protein